MWGIRENEEEEEEEEVIRGLCWILFVLNIFLFEVNFWFMYLFM